MYSHRFFIDRSKQLPRKLQYNRYCFEMAKENFVTPGDKVGDAETHNAGHGVYEEDGLLRATLVGRLVEDKPTAEKPKSTLRVASAKYSEGAPPLPEIGSRVTTKVTSVTPRAAHVEILVVDGRPLKELFKGMIRQQDVRQTEIDKVEIYKCFSPGDVILAEVLSLGDRHSYFLTTAKNELGVIYAKSRSGVPMIPVNWQEMECPATKSRELRKVAKY